ncbi:MAG: M23 family metallopeptidase [Cyanobacteriota bacterium]
MTFGSFSWGFSLNTNYNINNTFAGSSSGANFSLMGSSNGFLNGLGNPLDAFMSAMNIIDGNDGGNPYGLDFSNQQSNIYSPFSNPNNNYGSSAVAYAGPNGAFAAASSGGSYAAASTQPMNNNYQQNDPLAMNKMMGAQMEEIGRDLKDDGIINGSHKRQQQQQMNPMMQMMQMMMQFMMMLMQMMMRMFGMDPQQMGMNNQSNSPYNNSYNSPSQMAGLYGNNGGGASTSASAGSGRASATARSGNTSRSNNSGYVGQSNQPNAPINSKGLSSPTKGRVSSEFGMRTHPISGKRKMHTGIDIAAPGGTRVNSMANGKVVFAGKRGGYGNMVIVDHGNGVTTRYAHLSSLNVKNGQQVNAGQHLGGVGSTGYSTGNHLHFEVRENGQAVNPRKYINP